MSDIVTDTVALAAGISVCGHADGLTPQVVQALNLKDKRLEAHAATSAGARPTGPREIPRPEWPRQQPRSKRPRQDRANAHKRASAGQQAARTPTNASRPSLDDKCKYVADQRSVDHNNLTVVLSPNSGKGATPHGGSRGKGGRGKSSGKGSGKGGKCRGKGEGKGRGQVSVLAGSRHT
jgi:hypothetical protein